MSLPAAQRRAIEEVFKTLCSVTKGRRKLCEMFMKLPDKETWSGYYKVIPEPRCLEGIRLNLEKGKYKDASSVYDDLLLVFANALHYNEQDSQIAKDALVLKNALQETWEATQGLSSSSSLSRPRPEETTASKVMSKSPSSSKIARKMPSPPPLPLTNTMDDDMDGIPEELQENEPESTHAWESAAKDEESSEIVRQLERGLPRWSGGSDKGWMEEFLGDHQAKLSEIMSLLRTYETPLKEIPWQSLQAVPEIGIKNVSYTSPLSCSVIEDRVRSGFYTTSRHFDQDFSRLFEGARRWHVVGSHAYGLCLLLQRLYQHLTSPPYPNFVPSDNFNFSSITAGPGIARPIHSQTGESSHAVTTFRIPTKDRMFTDELSIKGWVVSMGDWVHLMNPDDCAKPIIGQVFKTWIPHGEGAKAQQGLTVCWYFRPEQTHHSAQRQFWENEVFKTDHVAEDVIEKIACQFTAKHIRGRPRPPYWYPGWPLYVCDSRYNDRERVFVKIKNWNSCIPEEFRKNDFMPIYPFERIIYPKLYSSPFLGGIKGSGQLIEGALDKPEADKPNSENAFRRRTRKSTQHAASANGGSGIGDNRTNESNTVIVTYPTTVTGSGAGSSSLLRDRSILSNMGANPKAAVEVLPAETGEWRDPAGKADAMDIDKVLWFSGPPIDVARTPAPQHSLKYLHCLAMRRKRKHGKKDFNGVDNDGEDERPSTKQRMTDQLNEIWTAVMHEG